MYICTYAYVHMCTMDSGYTVSTCGHCIHANTHTMTQDSQENGLETYVHTLHMYVHTCMQTHIRTYVRVQRMRMYTYDNSLSIHTLLYIRSRDEGHTCADTLTKVKTVSLGTGEKAPI